MHAARDPSVAGIVCDSPFASLHDVMTELVGREQPWVPAWAVRTAISRM
eukprot:gene40492-11313_t